MYDSWSENRSIRKFAAMINCSSNEVAKSLKKHILNLGNDSLAQLNEYIVSEKAVYTSSTFADWLASLFPENLSTSEQDEELNVAFRSSFLRSFVEMDTFSRIHVEHTQEWITYHPLWSALKTTTDYQVEDINVAMFSSMSRPDNVASFENTYEYVSTAKMNYYYELGVKGIADNGSYAKSYPKEGKHAVESYVHCHCLSPEFDFVELRRC